MSRELDQIVDGLRESPLFQLSLASKELFHSNLLAWLCETYPGYVGRLFAIFLSHAPPTCEGLRVYRESHHIDLLLRYPGGEDLVIENKVKSLPAREQLEEYSAAIRDKEKTSFLLLSLTRPAFLPLNETTIRFSDGTVWQCLTYRELADKLLEVLPHIAKVNSYHGQLLHDYVDFIGHLDALRTHFAIDWDDEQGDFFSIRRNIQRVKSIRLHDLIDKMCYGQLEQRVAEVLRKNGFPVIHEKLRDGHEGREGLVLVTAEMTRGVGLFDLKYFVMHKGRLGNPVILGVQVQGNQFRLVVEVWDKSKAREIAQALWQRGGSNLWFDFGLLPEKSEEYPRNRDFNQYTAAYSSIARCDWRAFHRRVWLTSSSRMRGQCGQIKPLSVSGLRQSCKTEQAMNCDPIVKEVREAGERLAAEAGYDVHRFFENLREVEKKRDQPLVREPVTKSSGNRPKISPRRRTP